MFASQAVVHVSLKGHELLYPYSPGSKKSSQLRIARCCANGGTGHRTRDVGVARWKFQHRNKHFEIGSHLQAGDDVPKAGDLDS